MIETYDTIVVGLGAMGSAAAFHLAARGRRVLGLERFTPGHNRGSSHGDTRMIRQCYYEHPAYVPLVRRAYELWRQLARDTGTDLLHVTGGLMIGEPTSELITGSLHSARTHDLPHELLDGPEIARRFPVFHPAPGMVAVNDLNAGYVRAEVSVLAHLKEAERFGAQLRFEEPITGWTAAPGGDGVVVETAAASYAAASLVLCPGAWAPAVLADLALPLRVTRQVLFWLDPIGGTENFAEPRCPVHVWTPAGYEFPMYGFPAVDGPGGGVKVAVGGSNQLCDPDALHRNVTPMDLERMRDYLGNLIPALHGPVLRASACMYTSTPDLNFVLTVHPQHPQVSVAAGFSGHGFKFAPVVGEILADLATSGSTKHPTGIFDPARFRADSDRESTP